MKIQSNHTKLLGNIQVETVKKQSGKRCSSTLDKIQRIRQLSLRCQPKKCWCPRIEPPFLTYTTISMAYTVKRKRILSRMSPENLKS